MKDAQFAYDVVSFVAIVALAIAMLLFQRGNTALGLRILDVIMAHQDNHDGAEELDVADKRYIDGAIADIDSRLDEMQMTIDRLEGS